MSWYYVGPDAKPVGPISLEDLQSRRAAGAIAPETYVIEAPPGSAPREWRRYRDFFPAPAPSPAGLPPLPTAPAQPPPATMGIPHPLFPSAPPVAPSPGGPVFTGTHPSNYRLPSGNGNPWCAWGFGLGLASLPFLLCGVGILVAVVGLICCIVGLVQIRRTRQDGRGLAIAGLILCVISLVIALAVGAVMMAGPLRKAIDATTEQTTNDSDTR